MLEIIPRGTMLLLSALLARKVNIAVLLHDDDGRKILR